jgi:hypothetical protein
MKTRSRPGRLLAALGASLSLVGSSVLLAPAAVAAPAALVAASPPPFGPVLVGSLGEQNVTVTNTGTSSISMDLASPNSKNIPTNLFDYFPGPALLPQGSPLTSCLTVVGTQLTANSISAGQSCELGIWFVPYHFGTRATTMQIADSNSGVFTISGLTGDGVGGYYVAGGGGEFDTFGYFTPPGLSSPGMALNRPFVGIAGTPTGAGFWADAGDGGVFSFGDATFHGSAGNIRLNKPVVGMATTPTGGGYWLVASDGGIFNYGDAVFQGSTGNIRLNQPVVGMAATPSGHGYWLVASDGGIFNYGDAGFFGSTGGIRLNQLIVGMATTPDGLGYWLVASDGGVFNFGDASYYGSTGNIRLNKPVVGIAASPDGRGYWTVASDGGVFNFNVPMYGSFAPAGFTDIVGMAPTTSPLTTDALMAPFGVRQKTPSVRIFQDVQSGRIAVNRPTVHSHR